MKKVVSWKILLPLGFVMMIAFRKDLGGINFGVIGDSLELLSAFLILFGLTDLVRSFFKKPKK